MAYGRAATLGVTRQQPTQPQYSSDPYGRVSQQTPSGPVYVPPPTPDYNHYNPRAGEGYDPMAQAYRAPGPTTQRTLTRLSDGRDVMDTSQWDRQAGEYRTSNTQIGPSAADRFRQSMMGFDDLLAKLKGFSGSLPARIQPPDPANRAAYNAAVFGRAKDRIGATSRAAADDLANEMSARGISGSGIEGAELGKILNTSQGQLGEANRDMAIKDLTRFEHNEDRDYAGNIQQRGQDISFESSKGQMINPLISLLRLQAGLY